jgi:hypothetical protein
MALEPPLAMVKVCPAWLAAVKLPPMVTLPVGKYVDTT